ncbi:MAG: 3,4-dihydroxy-2-butanone-4-phosphate synthase, partial [Bacteroidota bacterium]
VIVVDDEDRENEGDFVCAAEKVTPEIINFMAKEGRGLICCPLLASRCEALQLTPMVSSNTAVHETPFTVSVDLIGYGCTTGISASDRAKTIQALVNPATKPEELGRPGHIFPLIARKGGVLRRTGHTEAAIDLARLAGLTPAGVLVEIMNEDGSMARLPNLRTVADKFNLKLVTIKDLIEYRLHHDSLITQVSSTPFPSRFGSFHLHAFKQLNSENLHIAMVKGNWETDEAIPVRVHASNILEDLFGLTLNHRGGILQTAMQMIDKIGKGIVLYINNPDDKYESLSESIDKIKAQITSKDTLNDSQGMNIRDYGIGAQILRNLGVSNMRLISNKPKKMIGLTGYGLKIIDNIPIETI